MCGIVGYVGIRPACDVVLSGLRRLEYRGYDSAGVAVVSSRGALRIERRAGRLANLEQALAENELAGSCAIGHTRWATHGAPTDANAHPHQDCNGDLAVVHNGIIENFAELRHELEAAGHELRSETDTELVAHLLEKEIDAGLAEGVRRVARRLRGAFTLVVTHREHPDVIVGARRNSPLVVGVGSGEMFLASDVSAFIEFTRDAIELAQDQVVEVSADGYTITDFAGGRQQGRFF
ncbi:MAG TPA: glutamine--fructose-6-phosphate aminotransferase, partial [Mycobacteriales bacterium]|nr:glutamine--fructose-6-phosphate aminotransferase [Mycobacteriales bacterium]